MHPASILCMFAILLVLVGGPKPRVHAEVLLSEFMASNGGFTTDEDGNSPDWIELYNPDTHPAELAGWSLTDDRAGGERWVFPDIELPPGSHLIVFASGKDRRTASQELHTNFKLDADGEYLALLRPDGSAATAFAPAFPSQRTDVSYGAAMPSSEHILVQEGSAARARIPDAAYDALVGTTWRLPDPAFDDSSWTPGTLGAGYDTKGTYDSDLGLDIQSGMLNINGSAYVRIPLPPIDPAMHVGGMTLRMKYDDGFAAFLNGVPVAASHAPDPPQWNSLSTEPNDDDVAQIFEDFDLSAYSGLLGTNNLLAVQVLNRTLSSSDLLMLPELHVRYALATTDTEYGYFETATPGTLNEAVVYEGLVSDTHFEAGRGFYTNGFTEVVHCREPGAVLVYTLDGTAPTATHGIQIPAPDAGTAPTATVQVAGTTILRVRAVKPGYLASNIDTQTYLIPADRLVQDGSGLPLPSNSTSIWDYDMDPQVVQDPRYPNLEQDLLSLPSISVVGDPQDLWGADGVYANPTRLGFDWERACSVEYLRPDGQPGFQEDGGIRIQGAGSRHRDLSKKSMRLVFRQIYGNGKLDYPLFGERGAEQIDNIVLRGGYFDSWTVHTDGSAEGIARKNALLLRDEYGRQTHQDMGARPVVQGDWAHLYLNGMYWGVYNIHERPDQHFAEHRFGGDDDEYDVLKQRPRGAGNGTPPELVAGDRTAWEALMTTVQSDLSDPAVYATLQSQMDVDAFADYLVLNFWGGNNDWPHNNWYAMRHRPTNAPFTFVAWDVEHYLFLTNDDGPINTSTDNSPGIIWNRLQQQPEFMMYFADRVHHHFFHGGALSPERCAERFQGIVDRIHDGMNPEGARWGDTRVEPPMNTIDHFDTVVADKLSRYFPARTGVILNHLISRGYYPSIPAPTFSQHGGQVAGGFQLTLESGTPGGTVIYTIDGSDPRLAGGAIHPSAITGTRLILEQPTRVKARVRKDSTWSALCEATFVTAPDPVPGDLVIAELHYHPAPPTTNEILAGYTNDDDFEYLEMLNVSTQAFDLSGLSFTGGVRFSFGELANPSSRMLEPGGRGLLVARKEAVRLRAGDPARPVLGEYEGRLDNDGDHLVLTLGTNEFLAFSYDDTPPWPLSPDGKGPSMVLRAPQSLPNHADPGQWRPSVYYHGSPGQAGPASAPYPPHPAGDQNLNGQADLADYALARGPVLWGWSEGSNRLHTVYYARNLRADRTRLILEQSSDLVQWTPCAASNLVEETHHGNGEAQYFYQWSQYGNTPFLQFFRIRVLGD